MECCCNALRRKLCISASMHRERQRHRDICEVVCWQAAKHLNEIDGHLSACLKKRMYKCKGSVTDDEMGTLRHSQSEIFREHYDKLVDCFRGLAPTCFTARVAHMTASPFFSHEATHAASVASHMYVGHEGF